MELEGNAFRLSYALQYFFNEDDVTTAMQV
jgi:hypothetical protein